MEPKKHITKFYAGFLFSFALLLLPGCGIEDYPYLPPIPRADITQTLNNHATVFVQSYASYAEFTHFAVFYRIYISDSPIIESTTESTYRSINPALAEDFSFFSYYIDSDTMVNVNMDSLFTSRRAYKYLQLEDHRINAVLSSAVWNMFLEFDFGSTQYPTLTITDRSTGDIVDGTYTLWRSDHLFSPQPNRYFGYHADMISPLNAQTNADVADKTGAASRDLTYVAMFIVAVGRDPATYSNVYSTPALIHVFLLPDA